jgi:hypothetical protein
VAANLTRTEAAAAVAERTAERDRIQSNLFELDSSFGKRLLDGATLVGVTQLQWSSVAVGLASVWTIFDSYSAVVRQATEILAGRQRTSGPLLPAITSLLTGPSVVFKGQEVPLANRGLTGSERPEERLTLDQAVERMTAAFTRAAGVVNAAESVWTEVSRRLDEASDVLGSAAQQATGLADDGLRSQVAGIDADLRRLRVVLNTDPLSLWQADQVAVDGLDQLVERARLAASQLAELARLRDDADRRIADVADRVVAAQACEHYARRQLDEAEQKIVTGQLPRTAPATDSLTQRLAALPALLAANRYDLLATELQAIEKYAAAASEQWQQASSEASALLDRRSELRGLLDAYQAKAGQLGAAEDPGLVRSLKDARDLLWSAPCDLATAAEAVRRYQNAVLAIQKGTP